MNFQAFICFVIFFDKIVKSEEPPTTTFDVPTGNFHKKLFRKNIKNLIECHIATS